MAKRWPKLRHKGLQVARLQHPSGERERAFAAEWEKESEAVPGRNYGHGILQDLMLVPNNHAPEPFRGRHPSSDAFGWMGVRWAFIVTQREATIVATVIQWLGTNCGFCFLESALRRCGYAVLRRADVDAMRAELYQLRQTVREQREHTALVGETYG